MDDLEKKIRDTLELLRASLQNDGGDLEVLSIVGKNVTLKLKGSCGTCPYAQMTLKEGIENCLRENVDKDIVVERG